MIESKTWILRNISKVQSPAIGDFVLVRGGRTILGGPDLRKVLEETT